MATVKDVKRVATAIMKEMSKVIIGKKEEIKMLIVSLLSDGHVLLEGPPGIAKTFMANNFAKTLGCSFKRIQFTPDLLPSDITGTMIYNQKTGKFEFRPGPIFANIILADEINRAPPKTQAALLEAMQEHQVTIEGITYKLPEPFMVLATQNFITLEGTFPLPEPQLDRFLFRLFVDYPTPEEEAEIIKLKHERYSATVSQVTTAKEVIELQKVVRDHVYISDELIRYIASLVVQTRQSSHLLLPCSPRASLVLLNGAKALAAMAGRDYVVPDDIKQLVFHAFNHRMIVRPEVELEGITAKKIIDEILSTSAVPK